MEVELPCGRVTEIDDEDFYLKELFPYWRVAARGYVLIGRDIPTDYGPVRQNLYLSRVILQENGEVYGRYVDHKDRNPLNNKKSNLRYATPSENGKNKSKSKNKTSQYYGVSLCRKAKTNPWRIFVRTRNDKQKRITGCFATELEAAKKYDEVVRKEWGEFAPLNFPDTI